MTVWGPWFSKPREKLSHRWRGEALIWSALSSRVPDDWMASLMLSFQAEDQLCLFSLSLPLCLVFLLLNHSSVFPLTCVFSLVNHFSIFISCDSPPSLISCLFCNFLSFSQSPFPFPSLSHHHTLSSNPKKEHTFFFFLLRIPSLFTDLCAKEKIPRPPPCQCSEIQQLSLLNKVLVSHKSADKRSCNEPWHGYVCMNMWDPWPCLLHGKVLGSFLISKRIKQKVLPF